MGEPDKFWYTFAHVQKKNSPLIHYRDGIDIPHHHPDTRCSYPSGLAE